MSEFRKRFMEKISQFKIGDSVEIYINGADLDGEIISIANERAIVHTKYGDFTEWLGLCRRK